MIATAGLLTVPPEINNRRETPCGRGCLALLVAPPSRLSRVLIFPTGGGGYASKVTTRIGDLQTGVHFTPLVLTTHRNILLWLGDLRLNLTQDNGRGSIDRTDLQGGVLIGGFLCTQ